MLSDEEVTAILRLAGDTPAPEPPGLPPVQQDPALIAATKLQDQVVDDMNAVRGQFGIADIPKAVQITKIWEAAETKRVALYKDFTDRYAARLNWLYDQFPYGPGIPAGTSAADKAVLMTAFNLAVEKTRNSPLVEREKMLHAAQRYGDELTVRAILSVCNEDSYGEMLDKWSAAYSPAMKAYIREWRELNGVYEGGDFVARQFITMAFHNIPKPDEANALPGLVAAHNAAAQEYNRSASAIAANGRRLVSTSSLQPIYDVSELLAGA